MLAVFTDFITGLLKGQAKQIWFPLKVLYYTRQASGAVCFSHQDPRILGSTQGSSLDVRPSPRKVWSGLSLLTLGVLVGRTEPPETA